MPSSVARLAQRLTWAGSWQRLVRVAVKWGGRVALVPLRELFRPLVRALPRNERLVVIGAAADRFSDNPAYLYLYLAALERDGVDVVWVTGSKAVLHRLRSCGLPAVQRRSVRGMFVCLRAGWYVVGSYVSDISRWTYDGARVLNLWHGIGLKVIERQISTGPLSIIQKQRSRFSPMRIALQDDTLQPDFVLSSTDEVSRAVFSPAFDLDLDRCLPFGYPRTDHLLASPDWRPHAALVASLDTWQEVRDSDRPVVGYFPTWRDDQNDFLASEGVSIQDIADLIDRAGGRMLFKAHFNAELRVESGGNVLLLDPAEDVNAYLPSCAVLLTDYSSIATDFVLLDRPILYYVPDYDRYFAGRPSPLDRDLLMPGPKLATLAGVEDALTRVLADSARDEYGHARHAMRDVVWGDYAGHAAEHIAQLLRD